MTRKTTGAKNPAPLTVSIPEPVKSIAAAVETTDGVERKVPMLVLSGEWLKAAGFPIGVPVYIVPDERGALTLHRLSLHVPRRLRVIAGDA